MDNTASFNLPTADEPDGSRPFPLLRLPADILILIIQDDSLSRTDVKNLFLTSSRLFNLPRRRFYHAENFETFRRAIEAADLDTIHRCVKYRAAPVDIAWELGYEGHRDFNIEPIVRFSKPINQLVDALRWDGIPTRAFIQVLEWLVDNGADMRDGIHKKYSPADRTKGNMCSTLLSLFQSPVSRDEADTLCGIIHRLRNQGLDMPPAFQVDRMYPWPPTDDSLFMPFSSPVETAMAIMMSRSACPPSILELFLLQVQARDVHLTADISTVENGFFTDYLSFGSMRTPVRCIVGGLYDDLLRPWGWKEKYPGEITDIFEQKIQLLRKYHGATEMELSILESILHAVRTIQIRSVALNGLDIERDAKTCWYELAMSAREAVTELGMGLPTILGVNRVHQFIHCPNWEPLAMWRCFSRWAQLPVEEKRWEPLRLSYRESSAWEVSQSHEWLEVPLEDW
ncbi:hypothetical protein FDECE_13334 [Fusarium decemcellulare]|nr:hypothetical protein FDECE_13334 [Fusarium decemcellulare]